MANKKITQLVNKTTILSTDLFPIGDATTGQLYKKTVAELQAAIGGAVISVNAKVGTVVLTTDDVLETVSPANQYFTTTRSRASVSATTPLAYNSSTGVFSIPVATTSANGYLSSTDWTTFNGKENVLTFSGPLVRTTNTISIPVATTSVNGYLSSTDWTTFNNKQGALTLTVTGSSGASTLVGTTLNIPTYTLAGLGGITATFLSAGAGITYSSSTGIIASTITQYTDALARAAHSFTAGSGAYNSTTGVITIPTNTNQLTNGASFITLGSLSGGTGITYNSSTGAISYSGTVYTDASIRSLISLTTTGSSGASTYNSTTGVLNIPNYGSSISGTINYIPKFTSSNGIGNSNLINDASGNLGLGVTPSAWSVYKAYQVGYSALAGYNDNDLALLSNGYFNGTNYIYIGTGYATQYRAYLGAHQWHTAPSGTAGTAITFTQAMTLNTSGNLGLGVTPSAWTSGKVLQTVGGSLWGLDVNTLGLVQNAFLNGASYNYISSAAASYYIQASGQHIWYNAASGTAGTSVTFTQAMTLTNTGNLLVGTTTDSGYKLDINGTGRFSSSVTATSGTFVSSGTKSTVSIGNTATSTYSQLLMYGGATKYNWSIGAQYNVNNALEITPSTATEGTTFSTPVVTILQSGNVGIGTTSPADTNSFSRALDLNGPSGSAYYTRYNGLSTIYGFFAQDSATTYLGTATSPLVFYINSAERMRITSGGNLLIGTTTDSGYKLSVNGDIRAYSGGLILDYSGASGGIKWAINPFISGVANGGFEIKDLTNNVARFTISSIGAATFSSSVTAGGDIVTPTRVAADTYNGYTGGSTPLTIQTGGAQNIIFGTNATERMRITSGGNILLGTTTDNGERLYVSGAIRATGTITANSDIRLKKNLERIENALEKVGQISGYTYNTIYDDKRHGGVIAQEIDEVFPEIVNKGNDGLLGVEYGNISALLIEALKELKEKNTALEARLQALEK